MSQTEFASYGGVKKWSQVHYEKGTHHPRPAYFEGIARAGADVAYIVTGQPAVLRDALANVRVATEAARSMAGVEYQIPIFESLQAQRAQRRDENQLVADYRRCTSSDQKTIRQMAARLASDTPAESKARPSSKKHRPTRGRV